MPDHSSILDLIAEIRGYDNWPGSISANLMNKWADALQSEHERANQNSRAAIDLEKFKRALVRVEAERDRWQDLIATIREDLTAKVARIAALEAALEPFVLAGKTMEGGRADSFVYGVRSHEPGKSYQLLVGDFLKAAALNSTSDG